MPKSEQSVIKETPEDVLKRIYQEKYKETDVPKSDQELLDDAKDCFTYHSWDKAQIAQGDRVRDALLNAYKVIIENCPASPDRSVALRKIREARMDANSAITHEGRY